MKIFSSYLAIGIVLLTSRALGETGLEKCNRDWVELSYQYCLQSLQYCRAHYPPNSCGNETSCDIRICVRIPGHFCRNYSAAFKDQPYYTGGYGYYEDNCTEPDLTTPPPVDPFSDPRDPIKPPQCSNPNAL